MQIPLMDLKAQYNTIKAEVLDAIQNVCENAQFALGPAVEAFELDFAKYCEAKHCIALNTGTSALHLALRALDIEPGDEVITVPMTFIATAWSISYVGAKPVFVDIDPVTRTLNPLKLEKAITQRTKAIMPVHLYGQPAEMDAILAIAERHGIPVIEDAAQAQGARYKGKRTGSIGTAAGFSFYPSKNLGAFGEGGALTTNDDKIAERVRSLRDHAQSSRYHHVEVGYNYRMDGVQGAVLGVKLKHLDDWNAARRRHFDAYRKGLAGSEKLTLPIEPDYAESACHLFSVETDDRDILCDGLTKSGIGVSSHYPIPVHLQPAYSHLGRKAGSFPVSERLANRCLSLPMFPEMSAEQIRFVCDSISRVDQGAREGVAG